MKFSKILLTLLLFLTIGAKAQLDLEHWFPPIYQSTVGNLRATDIRLFLSTDKKEKIKVILYVNNVNQREYYLDKDNPVNDFVGNFPVLAQPMKVFGKNGTQPAGIHLAGSQSFYASIRLSGGKVSEMIASKGKTALGTEFFVVNDQTNLNDPDEPDGIKKQYYNYQASFMSLEDNTSIKISNYDKRLIFENGDTSDELNIVLNKGESYIVAALKSDNPPPAKYNPVLDNYAPNFIGAKITADKKIVVTNGNFLSHEKGDIGGDNTVDIIIQGNINMDQSLPTSALGKEYFIANGLTNPVDLPSEDVKTGGMEQLIIVAAKDNTAIYFNEEKHPFTVLNAGEYLITPISPGDNKWINGSQPSNVNSSNNLVQTKGMYIRTSKPAYVYQKIGGYQARPKAPDPTDFTSGMMLSYPIDKSYLQDDRQKGLTKTLIIPSISTLNGRSLDTKITIKTENTSNIVVNDRPISRSEFSEIVGKPGWSYWSQFDYPNGDFRITSDKSINVDYTGGYTYSGLAGSSTGFSNDPFVIKNGNCIEEGVFLYLSTTDFQSFQWKRDGINIPGETSPTITPKLPGNYTCDVSYMDFTFTPTEVRVDACPYLLVEKDLGPRCHSFAVDAEFIPIRRKDEVASTRILTQPLRGKANITDDIIFVEMDEDFSGENRLVYEIRGKSGFSQTVKLNFTIYPPPTIELKESLFPKGVRNTSFIYDLPSATTSNPDGNKIKYFLNKSQSNTDEITEAMSANFATTKTEIYAQITYGNGCTVLREINLIQTKIPDQPGNPDALLPNFFSPNDDGVNDFWCYENLGNMSTLQLAIFDRFGTKVYEHTDKGTCWDGKTTIGGPVPTGTYWVYYLVIDENGNQIQKSQWILLKNTD